MLERNWSEYRLAKEAGLAQSTIANLFQRNTVPTIYTLEAICKGLGITLSQFFAEDALVPLDAEQRAFFERWKYLSAQQKRLLYQIIDSFP